MLFYLILTTAFRIGYCLFDRNYHWYTILRNGENTKIIRYRFIFVAVIRYPANKHLRGKWLILAHNSILQSITTRKSKWQELEANSQMVSTSKEQCMLTHLLMLIQLSLLLYSSGPLTHGLESPTVGCVSSHQLRQSRIIIHRHPHMPLLRFSSQVVLVAYGDS